MLYHRDDPWKGPHSRIGDRKGPVPECTCNHDHLFHAYYHASTYTIYANVRVSVM